MGRLPRWSRRPRPSSPYGLTLADLNGDQRLDAVSLQDLALVVQSGRGDGTFLAEQTNPYTAQSSRPGSTLNLVDLDGDGFLDAIPLNPVEQGFNILFGQAGGAWTAPMALGLSATPYVGYVGDYTQDGVPDILIAYGRTAAKVGLLQGLGGRRFSALPDVALNNNFRMQTQGDFNGDGLADLVTMDAGTLGGNLVIYLGTGGGHFVALPVLTVPVGPSAAAVGDFDGDGRQDLVTLSSMGDSICVLRSMPQ